MTFSKEQIEALKAPLSTAHVKQRSQAGRSLSYIEGWHAIDEANRIFGFDKWLRLTEEIKPVCEPYQDQKGNWRVGYMARVRIVVEHDGGELMRDGCGYGSGIDRDLGSAHESAIKEAETDAMKRALMTFGNPFGLALYDKEQRNVVDEPAPKPTSSGAAAYVALAKTAMHNFTGAQEMDDWWVNEGPERERHGIKGGKDRATGEIQGTPEYLELVKAFGERKAALTKRAA